MHNRLSHSCRWLAALVLATLALAPGAALAQGQRQFRESTVYQAKAGEWTGPRLADGQPDVQGHWSNTVGNHNNWTDPQGGMPGDADDRPPARPRAERAPSRVSEPADGELPYQPWARAKQQEFLANFHNPTKPEYVEPLARCAPGGPTKSFVWHGYEIRQFPGYVVFLFDSGTRIVHLDGKPHLPESVKLWNGDSRGRWEGNTLVVDVANNNSKSRFSRTGDFVGEGARIQERFIFDNNRDRYTYEAVYTDAATFTRPFTITIPARRITETTPQDGWNNLTFPAKHAGTEKIFEAYERTCVENNGHHGQVAVESK